MYPRFPKLLTIQSEINQLLELNPGQKENILETLERDKPTNFEKTIQERKAAAKEICPEHNEILEEFIDIVALQTLKTPKEYVFHDFEHTFVYVLKQIEELLNKIELNSEEKKIIYIAAIAHDIGHLIERETHERYSQLIIFNLLKKHNIEGNEKKAIELMIKATMFPHDPELEIKKELETQYPNIHTMIDIIRDADIGHLATPNFENYTQQYIKYLCERLTLKPIDPQKDTELKGQQVFHKTIHEYKTNHATTVRKMQKQKNLEQLESIRDDLRTQLEKHNFNYDLIKQNRDTIRTTIQNQQE